MGLDLFQFQLRKLRLFSFTFQAVHIEIINLTPETHHRWTEKETAEEMLEDKQAIEEEAKINELIVRHRTCSTSCYSNSNTP